MTKSEAVFIWIAAWIYGMSFLAFLYGLVFRNEKGVRFGFYLAVSGLVPQVISAGIRWAATGHPPIMREYENALTGSSLVLIVFIMLRHWYRRVEAVGALVMPVILMMLGNALMKRPYLEPLNPSFKSNWLWIHICFAWIAYGAFCIGAGLGMLYLLKERVLSKGGGKGFYERLPELEVISDLILRMMIFGFAALTVQIGAGSIWAYGLWGRYWGWDPIETWSLITWFVYGTYIHFGVTLGWKGKKMAWLAIVSLISLFITYGGIGYMASVHMTMM